MKLASNLCCTLSPIMYCRNCRWKLCQECKDNLYPRPSLGKGAEIALHHSYHSLCIKRDINYFK